MADHGGVHDIGSPQNNYQQNLKGHPVSTTGLGACIETPEGELFMLVNAFSASPSENDLNTTVFEWKSASKDRYCGSAVLSFNEVVYNDAVRESIEQKLINKAVKAASEFEIRHNSGAFGPPISMCLNVEVFR